MTEAPAPDGMPRRLVGEKHTTRLPMSNRLIPLALDISFLLLYTLPHSNSVQGFEHHPYVMSFADKFKHPFPELRQQLKGGVSPLPHHDDASADPNV